MKEGSAEQSVARREICPVRVHALENLCWLRYMPSNNFRGLETDRGGGKKKKTGFTHTHTSFQ